MSKPGNPLDKSDIRESRSVYERSYRWFLSKRDAFGVSVGVLKQEELVSAGLAILLLDGLNRLESITREERTVWIEDFTSRQNPESGLFIYPSNASSTRASATYDDFGRDHQLTYLVLKIFDALGVKTRHPLRFVDKYCNEKTTIGWLKNLDWANPNLTSNKLMLLLTFLINRVEQESNTSAVLIYHQILDWLDQNQESKTGLWGTRYSKSPVCPMNVAYRLIPFYAYIHRPLNRMSRILEYTLQIKINDGPYSGSFLYDSLTTLSIAYILTSFSSQIKSVENEVSDALTKTYSYITDSQNKDGGFSDSIPSAENTIEFDLLAPIKLESNQSNLWDTWLRLLTLATISNRFPHGSLNETTWNFPLRPGIGYASKNEHLNDHERRVLPLWIRPLSQKPGMENASVRPSPAISVIVPCFNLGRYLTESIDSILAQTAQDYEIIIIDDGSTEEYTQLILSHLSRPKTRLIHQENQGLAATRNIGIRESKGRYICCLDADDRLRPGFFEKAISVLDSNPGIGIVTGHMSIFDGWDGICDFDKCEIPDELVKNQVIVPAVFRTEAWEKAGGFCESFSISGIEDWDLWISILELGYKAHVIPEILYDYRDRPESMTKKMQKPETWSALLQELTNRHRDTYSKYLPDVISKSGFEWAKLLEWARDRERGLNWWERQSANLQRLAQKQESIICEKETTISKQKSWIEELQRKHWFRIILNLGLVKRPKFPQD
jgi:glycosyltransferase involved in cell wall biosynthesis